MQIFHTIQNNKNSFFNIPIYEWLFVVTLQQNYELLVIDHFDTYCYYK